MTFLGGCQLNDIQTVGGGTLAGACKGFYDKNTLGANDNPTTAAALLALGLTWNNVVVESLDLNSPTVNFNTLLSGTTYIGIHWGAGQGPVNTPGGVSAYYRLDLAPDAKLDLFKTNFGSNSGARLYSTQACVGNCGNGGAAIPEPSTWAMMIMGFGGAGYLIRRRRYSVA